MSDAVSSTLTRVGRYLIVIFHPAPLRCRPYLLFLSLPLLFGSISFPSEAHSVSYLFCSVSKFLSFDLLSLFILSSFHVCYFNLMSWLFCILSPSLPFIHCFSSSFKSQINLFLCPIMHQTTKTNEREEIKAPVIFPL